MCLCAQVSAQGQDCGAGGHQDTAGGGWSTQVHKHGVAEPALLGECLSLSSVFHGCNPEYPASYKATVYVYSVRLSLCCPQTPPSVLGQLLPNVSDLLGKRVVLGSQ